MQLPNQIIWTNPDINMLRRNPENEYPTLTQILQGQLRLRQAQGKLVLPDLRAFKNNAVAVFSDYGGESSGQFHTYSALVCGYSYTGVFNKAMTQVRAKEKLYHKEIAYKDLGMGQIQRSLPKYLSAMDGLPGFLCTVAVDKRIRTLFGPLEADARVKLSRILANEGLGMWKPDVAEKLLRIVHLTAFLVSLLAHDGQKIFWMTDNDAICPTEAAHKTLLQIFDRILAIYTRFGCTFPIVGGARPFQPRDVATLDLLSIADMVAGAIEPCIPIDGAHADPNIKIKLGADKVLRWLSNDGPGLKKWTVVIRLAANGTLEGSCIDLQPV